MLDGEPICLLRDQYTMHITNAVVFTACELGIQIKRISKRATGQYQPLGRRVFREIKLKRKAKRERHFMEHYGGRRTKEMAAELAMPRGTNSLSLVSLRVGISESPLTKITKKVILAI
jgi:hypothetical protein